MNQLSDGGWVAAHSTVSAHNLHVKAAALAAASFPEAYPDAIAFVFPSL
jgi:hypothetical protein